MSHSDPNICCNPCRTSECDASNEPVASQFNNFVAQFFGSLTKTFINGNASWMLPCELTGEDPNFPRLPGESLACYFIRTIEDKVVDSLSVQGLEAYGFFYGLMPPDNAALITPGSHIDFTNVGPARGGIAKITNGSFLIPDIGTYEILALVGFSTLGPGTGEICLRLNGVELPNTASTQYNLSIITTTIPNSVLEVINPSANTSSLTIDDNTGSGAEDETCCLSIKKI